MGRILVGTGAWAEEELVKSGLFYPPGVNTPEKLLRYYSSQFSMVEVDSTYYALPLERNAINWAERTPDGFVFDVKAFALMTTHPTEVNRLPDHVRDMLPTTAREKARIYMKDVPAEAMDIVWRIFRTGIKPLADAGKLGAICFQFPKWFPIDSKNKEHILYCKSKLPEYRIAIEFRQNSWLSPDNIEETLDFLEENDLIYTAVDIPQGFESSIPPIAAATSSSMSIVRLHGRNKETWEKTGISTAERFNYLYTEEELNEWVPRILELAEEVKEVHVILGNKQSDHAVVNARQMQSLIETAQSTR